MLEEQRRRREFSAELVRLIPVVLVAVVADYAAHDFPHPPLRLDVCSGWQSLYYAGCPIISPP